MSGAMWMGLGQGLAGAGSAIAQGMTAGANWREKTMMDEQYRRDKMLQDRQLREAYLEIQRDKADKSGGGGGSLDLSPGSQDLAILSARMGMTQPEVLDMLQKMQTGTQASDITASKDIDPANSDAMSRRMGSQTVTLKEPAQYDKDKARALGEIMTELKQGKDYEKTTAGRQNVSELGVMDKIARGDLSPEEGGLIRRAQRGEPLRGGNESGTYSLFNDESSLNALGKAKIGKEKSGMARDYAAAGKDKASIGADEKSRRANERSALKDLLVENGRDLRAAESRLKDPMTLADDTLRQSIEDEIRTLKERRQSLQEQLDAFAQRQRDGGGETLSKLPPGAVQIGTKGGKPVYRLPNGSMVIEQ